MRYVHSVVRFVPDPATGEFVNVGAIAGNELGDWSVRQAQNPKRARNFGPPESFNALLAFLTDIGRRIDLADSLDATEPELSEQWLAELYERHRNVVQLSPPAPLVAESAEEALDLVFAQMIEPNYVREQLGYYTRSRVVSAMRRHYRDAGLQPAVIRERRTLSAGPLNTPIDFAVANGRAVQLVQTWSFQLVDHAEVAKQVKAWGYTMEKLKSGGGGTIDGDTPVHVAPDIDIEVLYAPPRTAAQQEVFDEARSVFDSVEATAVELSDAGRISARAAELLGVTHS